MMTSVVTSSKVESQVQRTDTATDGATKLRHKCRGKFCRLMKLLLPVILAPIVVAMAVKWLQELPERTIDFHITVDLRVGGLLGVIATFLFLVTTYREFATSALEEATTTTMTATAAAAGQQAEQLIETVCSHATKTPGSAALPVGLQAELRELSEAFLRSLVTIDDEQPTTCPRELVDQLKLSRRGDGGKELLPAGDEVEQCLADLRVSCAFSNWKGNFADFCVHARTCPYVQGAVNLRLLRLAEETDERARTLQMRSSVDAIHRDMIGASPSLLHRFPPESLVQAGYWSTPLFHAFGNMWYVCCGSVPGAREGARYFCIVGHGHGERLRCSLVFAKRPGEGSLGYVEKSVQDWPVDKAGQPWGPTLGTDELEKIRQADGSLLFMVHALGLMTDHSAASPRASSGAQ
jgi:hypothetical protein